MHLAVLVILAVLGLWWFTRTRELFYLSVRSGRVLVVRGRISAGLLGSFKDVLHGTNLTGAVKGLKQDHGGRLVTSGDIDDGTTQRLRNVFALYPTSKLRQAPAIERPTLGQLTGIATLAWLFEDVLKRR